MVISIANFSNENQITCTLKQHSVPDLEEIKKMIFHFILFFHHLNTNNYNQKHKNLLFYL